MRHRRRQRRHTALVADGRWLFDAVAKQGRTPLVRVTRKQAQSQKLLVAIRPCSISPSRPMRACCCLVSTPVAIGDLFRIDKRQPGRRANRINRREQDALVQLNLTERKNYYKSFDGMPIQGWIQKPPDFDPKKKYPLILESTADHMPLGWVSITNFSGWRPRATWFTSTARFASYGYFFSDRSQRF